MAPGGLTRVRQAESRGQEAAKDASPVGQEIIRGELKQLQDDYKRWAEELSEVGGIVEQQAQQWQAYDSNMADLNNWLTDAEIRMKADVESKGFGPDKTLLEVYRVSSQSYGKEILMPF